MDAVTAKMATVLLVEDSPNQTELLQRSLEEAGYNVIAARDGAEGIAAARATRPDAVVTDINMPVMDGYELCRAIRHDEALKLTPVILLTALSDPQDVIRGLAAGADAYLAKPYKLPALLSRIETLVASPLAAPPQLERRKLEVQLDGTTHLVDANGTRMLSLMVSAYENAVIRNEDLVAAQQVLKDLNEHLEQKVSEKTTALRNSETQLHNAMKIGQMAHWEYDFATDRFTFNDHFYAIFRTTAQNVGGYALSTADYAQRFVHPDDASVVAEETRAAIESADSNYSREFEHRIIYADGEIGHVAVRFIVVKDTHGRSIKTGVIQDITARKRGEREAEFKSTVVATQQDTSPDGILLVDENARILSYNRKFVELWDIPEDLVHAGNDETVLQWVVHQIQEPGAFIAKIRRLYEDRKAKVHDQVRTKDGRTIDRHSAPVVASNGIYYGRVWYFRDITERKQAEEQLKRLNWALLALSKSNSALVHAGDEPELFRMCCEAIASSEAYPLAWIGVAREDPECSVEIVGAAGEAIGYLEGFEVSWSETQLGKGPAGNAIRTGTTQVVTDLAVNTTFRPWLERARANGLASTAAVPIRVNGKIFGTLMVYSRELAAFGGDEVTLLEELAGDIGYGISTRRTHSAYEASLLDRAQQALKLRANLEGAIAALAATVEHRDPYTAGHQHRVAELAVAIGRELGLEEDRLEGLRVAGSVHDIGKIYVPAEILARPGRLSANQLELVKDHARVGYDIIKGIDFPWPIAQTIYQHHERLDGSGYPQGIKGDEILLEARILAVADVTEAMSSHRPYRPGLGLEHALDEIEKGSGKLYDPQVVGACLRVFREKGYQIPG